MKFDFSSFVVGCVLCYALGLFIGGSGASDKAQREAVTAGAAEYVADQETGEAKFRWKTMEDNKE